METNGARFVIGKAGELVSYQQEASFSMGGTPLVSSAKSPAPAVKGAAMCAESTLPPSLQPLATEIATYFRELPRLIAEGEKGRVALIRGDQIVSVWDTFRDAYQAGQDRFGLEPFIAQPINPRDLCVAPPKAS